GQAAHVSDHSPGRDVTHFVIARGCLRNMRKASPASIRSIPVPPRKPVSVLPVLRTAAFAAVLMAIAPAIHAQAANASTPAEPSFNAL
ncbi:hypothetical protein LI003_23015, partial [Bacteroides caccae]